MLEYTQHTIAWPNLRDEWRGEPSVYDELLINGTTSEGEFGIDFRRFADYHPEISHPRIHIFGYGLKAFYQPEWQMVMYQWRMAQLDNRDADLTPEHFIGWCEQQGIHASRYHLNPQP